MSIGNRALALDALQRISYYRLSAYWQPFKQPGQPFEPGTTFESALELYEFDRRLRLTVLDAIERVEVLARTRITYTLGHGYGAFAHTTAHSFDSRFGHTDWYTELSKEIALSIKPVLLKNQPAWSTLNNGRVYTVLCVIRELTRQNPDGEGWKRAIVGLLAEMNGKPRWLTAMGVPAGWSTQTFWT